MRRTNNKMHNNSVPQAGLYSRALLLHYSCAPVKHCCLAYIFANAHCWKFAKHSPGIEILNLRQEAAAVFLRRMLFKIMASSQPGRVETRSYRKQYAFGSCGFHPLLCESSLRLKRSGNGCWLLLPANERA